MSGKGLCGDFAQALRRDQEERLGAVVAGVFLLCRFGWVVGLLISGSGVRVVGATARERFLRIDLLGLRVLTAPCPAPPGFRTPQAHLRHATGASATRHRRIFDFRGNDPVSSTGQAGGRGRPSRSGGETRRTGLCGTGDITGLCDSQRCNGIRRAVRHRRICDHVRRQRLAVIPEPGEPDIQMLVGAGRWAVATGLPLDW